jgi:non-ribosomal peptide synthetase component F
VWQREWLSGEVLDEQLTYWKHQLAGSPPLLALPTDHQRPPVRSLRGATLRWTLTSGLTQRLKDLSRSQGVTLFMLLLAAFKVLLYRYGAGTDLLIGTPVAGRNRREVEPLIGFFVNTLVLRTDLGGEPTFSEVLRRVREVALGAYAHQEVPFEKIVEEVGVERSLGQTPLFQVMFALQNVPEEEFEMGAGLRVEVEEVESATAKFDLLMTMRERGEEIVGEVEYGSEIFERGSIERMVGHWERVLEAVVDNVHLPISLLPILSENERRQLLVEWNATEKDYQQELLIHHMIEQQAARSPLHVALSFDDFRLSYQALNVQANHLAHHLLALGIGPESIVAICLERSPQLVIALLAVLKAGGAYLPLEPSLPQERLSFMLADAAPSLLLTDSALRQRFAASDPVPILCLDAEADTISQQSPQNPTSHVSAENLAYVI